MGSLVISSTLAALTTGCNRDVMGATVNDGVWTDDGLVVMNIITRDESNCQEQAFFTNATVMNDAWVRSLTRVLRRGVTQAQRTRRTRWDENFCCFLRTSATVEACDTAFIKRKPWTLSHRDLVLHRNHHPVLFSSSRSIVLARKLPNFPVSFFKALSPFNPLSTAHALFQLASFHRACEKTPLSFSLSLRGSLVFQRLSLNCSFALPARKDFTQLRMSPLRILKRRQPLSISRKLLIDLPNTPRHDWQLLLPILPLPLHRLHLVRLKIMQLNRNRSRVGACVERRSVLCEEADLALGAVDSPFEGRRVLEGLAAAEADRGRCIPCGGGRGGESASNEEEVGNVGGDGFENLASGRVAKSYFRSLKL